MIYVKRHKAEEREIVAMCDEDLLGKTFEEGDLCLNVSVSFYRGELVDDEKAVTIMRNSDMLNLIGKDIVGLAVKNNLISSIHIIKIKGIPHAQLI